MYDSYISVVGERGERERKGVEKVENGVKLVTKDEVPASEANCDTAHAPVILGQVFLHIFTKRPHEQKGRRVVVVKRVFRHCKGGGGGSTGGYAMRTFASTMGAWDGSTSIKMVGGVECRVDNVRTKADADRAKEEAGRHPTQAQAQWGATEGAAALPRTG
jgi:hypothetical protein